MYSQVLTTDETRWHYTHETFYRHDNLGSVVAYEENNSIRPVKYTVFGNTVNMWNWPDKENFFGYNGKIEDMETGLYNYGFRDYSPVNMRWTTVDPIRDGTNWYAYVGNDPINYIDPLGLAEFRANPGDDDITIAIDVIGGTNFGETDYGQKVVSNLKDLNDKGQIKYKDLGTTTRAQHINYFGFKDEVININNNPSLSITLDELPGRLTHEGTHNVQATQGFVYGIDKEVQAFDNAAQVDIELGITPNTPTMEQLKEDYPQHFDLKPDLGTVVGVLLDPWKYSIPPRPAASFEKDFNDTEDNGECE
ncbi:RHS repeat-associated core domain-containing protein [Thiospirochaeta perfilievii]|uniref:RHS repeat-associated core domain-containing protein n=1 Tax=Thiospirochaeta perfilievii TaxID=252967 RepID=A0A5C1Q6N6_9SPIO|nr:RHS repeat-associated core domain-containing protein [Thiospirochaeta perfilievii]QEN03723.1 RHS repeat-associated core domain-containing protein [Thiospirochaeta perfilievii]